MRRAQVCSISCGWAFARLGTIVGLIAGVPHQAIAQETVTYYTTDAIGSVRMVTDADANVLARYDYRPFGDPCGSACDPQGSTEKVQFTGHERDLETGLGYLGTRYYSSPMGRFTSPDEPGIDQFLSRPQTLSLYAYVRNNPLKYIDDTGQGAILASSKYLLKLAARRGINRAWAAERRLIMAGKRGTVDWTADQAEELILHGRVKGFEGHHGFSVMADGTVQMAENPDNVHFLTRPEHFAEHGNNWQNPTKKGLTSRSSMAALISSLDREEQNMTSKAWCGSLCSPAGSWQSMLNPFNQLLDFAVVLRAVMLPKAEVTDSTCFGTYSQCFGIK